MIKDRGGGAVVKAQASDTEVGDCEFEPRRCHLTRHIPEPSMLDLLMLPV